MLLWSGNMAGSAMAEIFSLRASIACQKGWAGREMVRDKTVGGKEVAYTVGGGSYISSVAVREVVTSLGKGLCKKMESKEGTTTSAAQCTSTGVMLHGRRTELDVGRKSGGIWGFYQFKILPIPRSTPIALLNIVHLLPRRPS